MGRWSYTEQPFRSSTKKGIVGFVGAGHIGEPSVPGFDNDIVPSYGVGMVTEITAVTNNHRLTPPPRPARTRTAPQISYD